MTQHCYNCGKPFPAFITNGYVICGACGASNGDVAVPFGNYIVECSIDIPMQNIGIDGVVTELKAVRYDYDVLNAGEK